MLLILLTSCASAGAPPGGPERHAPPELLSITPDSGATNVHPKEMEFKFDEVVSNRPSGAASELDQLFLVSPRTGDPNVSWHRTRITVRPNGGFKPNTAYRITMLPGISDLRGNVRKDGQTIVFSTGPDFPPYTIIGKTFDWAAQNPARDVYVEALSHPDTNTAYVAASDSLGSFDLGPLPAGTYLVRGFLDANHNRILDRNEKWDTTTVVISTASPSIELDLIERDSVPPVFNTIVIDDSVTLHVSFDKPLDPGMQLDTSLIRLQRADSSVMRVTRVQWAGAYDKARQAAIADSIKRADTTHAAQKPPPTPPPTPAAPRGAPPPPKPRTPAPERAIVVNVSPSTPFVRQQTYRITAHHFYNLVGHTHEITRSFTYPKAPPPPKDTAKKGAPPDTARKRPPAGRPPGARPPG